MLFRSFLKKMRFNKQDKSLTGTRKIGCRCYVFPRACSHITDADAHNYSLFYEEYNWNIVLEILIINTITYLSFHLCPSELLYPFRKLYNGSEIYRGTTCGTYFSLLFSVYYLLEMCKVRST